MNGKKAKSLRREANKLNLPVVSYETKQHMITVERTLDDGSVVPMVVARYQVVLSSCIREVYQEYKNMYKRGEYVFS